MGMNSHKANSTQNVEAEAGDKALAFDEIFRILYENDDGEIDPNKEWDQGTIELVADAVRRVKSPE